MENTSYDEEFQLFLEVSWKANQPPKNCPVDRAPGQKLVGLKSVARHHDIEKYEKYQGLQSGFS